MPVYFKPIIFSKIYFHKHRCVYLTWRCLSSSPQLAFACSLIEDEGIINQMETAYNKVDNVNNAVNAYPNAIPQQQLVLPETDAALIDVMHQNAGAPGLWCRCRCGASPERWALVKTLVVQFQALVVHIYTRFLPLQISIWGPRRHWVANANIEVPHFVKMRMALSNESHHEHFFPSS